MMSNDWNNDENHDDDGDDDELDNTYDDEHDKADGTLHKNDIEQNDEHEEDEHADSIVHMLHNLTMFEREHCSRRSERCTSNAIACSCPKTHQQT